MASGLPVLWRFILQLVLNDIGRCADLIFVIDPFYDICHNGFSLCKDVRDSVLANRDRGCTVAVTNTFKILALPILAGWLI